MFVTLTKNGFKHNKKDLAFDLGFFQHWRDRIEIVEGVTLEDLINIIRSDNDDNITFLEMLTQCSISSFFEDLEEGVEVSEDLSHIEISKFWEERNFNKKDVSEFFEALNASGIYKEVQQDSQFPEHTYNHCCLDFTHWGKIKHLPLKIADYGEMLDMTNRKYNKRDVEATLSVSDFFCGLFDELCFNGSPDCRGDRVESLEKSMKEIRDGTAEFIPWEEVKERLESKLEEIDD